MNENFRDYHFQLKAKLGLPIIGEPEEYVNQIEGKIEYHDKEKSKFIKCGKLSALYVNLELACDEGVVPFHVLDSVDNEFARCTKLIKRSQSFDYCLSKPAVEALSVGQQFKVEEFFGNFVYLKRLEIIAAHRGKGIGLHFLAKAMIYLQQTLIFDFFAMSPFPLQLEPSLGSENKWESLMKCQTLEKNQKKAKEKLFTLYSQVGFHRVRGTNLMVCPLT
jgi:hypothetical protein